MEEFDPRVVRTRRQILDATTSLIATRGIEATTMEAIAEAAGVSRSTLYRHWPDRPDLLIEAITYLAELIQYENPAPPGADASLDDVLQHIAAGIGAAMRSKEFGAIAVSLAASAERDPGLGKLHRRYIRTRRDEVIAALTYAVEAGELPAALDLEWAVGVLVGPVYYQRIVMHDAMTKAQVRDHIARTIALLREPVTSR